LVLSPGSVAFLQKAGQLTPETLTRLMVAGPMRRELDTTIEAYVTVIAGKRLPPVDFLAAEPRGPAYEVKRL
jgi:DNA repair protein RecO (recombination protein O)